MFYSVGPWTNGYKTFSAVIYNYRLAQYISTTCLIFASKCVFISDKYSILKQTKLQAKKI